jgi:vacuolar-type H+-ATPase subunit E/Vma4
MKMETDDIDMLARAILTEARDGSEQIRAEAQTQAEAIRTRARGQAESERNSILDRARQTAERLRSQAVAAAHLKARALELEHREQLLGRVFQSAREKLPEIQKRPEYAKIVAGLLTEALRELRTGNAEVRGDAATLKVLKDSVLAQVAADLKVQLSLGKPLEEGSGLVVDAADGHLHFDNTLETRLVRLQAAIRSSVHQVLMGEKK